MSETAPGPQRAPALVAEVTKRSGLVWIAIDGQDRPRPAWHIWRTVTSLGPSPAGPPPPGAAYVVTGPGEQPLPGLADSGRVTVIVASRQTGGGPVTWTAAVSQVEPGSAEWDEVVGPLVAGRLNAVLPEGQTSPARRWAHSGAVFRLAPATGNPARTAGNPARATGNPARTTGNSIGGTTAGKGPALNSRTELPAASPAVHPGGRQAGHRRRRNSHQRGGS